MAQQALPVGLQCSMWSPFSLPFLLSRIGVEILVPALPISDARTCNRPCTYLQPSLQVPASIDSDVYCREKAPSSGTPFPGNFHRAHVSPLCSTYEKQEGNTCDKCLPPVSFSFNRDIRLPIRVRLHPEQQHWHSSSCLPGTWPCP